MKSAPVMRKNIELAARAAAVSAARSDPGASAEMLNAGLSRSEFSGLSHSASSSKPSPI